MKKHIFILSILLVAFNAKAQQELQFSQTLSNPYFFNPAAGGLSNVGEVFISQRTQWTGISGRPISYYGSINSIIDTDKSDDQHALQEFNYDRKSMYSSPERTIGKKHILGGKMFNDQIGPFSKNSLSVSYAYHLMLNETWNFGAGIGLGFSNFGIDETKSTLVEAGDQAFLNYAANSPRQNYLDASAGVVFYSKDLLVGLSTTQFMNTKATFDGVTSESNYNRHYSLLLSYRVKASSDIALEPFAIGKYVGNAPFSLDLGSRVHYKGMGFMSLAYRSQNSFSIGAGMNLLKNFRICYSYDVSIAKTRSFAAGSHEIQLGIIFGRKGDEAKPSKEEQEQLKQKIESEEDQ